MIEQVPSPLQGKVAVVTGASRGIGRAIALRLAADGARLVLSARGAHPGLAEVAQLCAEVGPEPPLIVTGDLAAAATVEAISREVTATWSRVDILVNNAGVAADDLLATLPDEALEEMIATNIVGLTRLTRALLRPMIRQRAGSIVNLSSVLARQPGRGNAVYAGTKGYVEAFTRALAAEVGRKQIRVNAIAPGIVDTAMSQGVLAVAREAILARVALGRLGSPEEVAALVAFLCSDQAAYISGAVIPLDGAVSGW